MNAFEFHLRSQLHEKSKTSGFLVLQISQIIINEIWYVAMTCWSVQGHTFFHMINIQEREQNFSDV